jgi:hypothetical protein
VKGFSIYTSRSFLFDLRCAFHKGSTYHQLKLLRVPVVTERSKTWPGPGRCSVFIGIIDHAYQYFLGFRFRRQLLYVLLHSK